MVFVLDTSHLETQNDHTTPAHPRRAMAPALLGTACMRPQSSRTLHPLQRPAARASQLLVHAPRSAQRARAAAPVASMASADSITYAVSPISDSPAWDALATHAKRPMPHLRQLLADEKRCSDMFVKHDGMLLDYSRQAGGPRPAAPVRSLKSAHALPRCRPAGTPGCAAAGHRLVLRWCAAAAARPDA